MTAVGSRDGVLQLYISISCHSNKNIVVSLLNFQPLGVDEIASLFRNQAYLETYLEIKMLKSCITNTS